MELPLWFSNLAFWSLQVAVLVLAAGILARALRIQQPRVLLASWRSLLAVSLLLPLLQPWHHPQAARAIAISPDFAGLPLSSPSTPAATHWHLPSLQTIASVLGIVILVGIALRLAILALGLLKLRRLRQASSPISSSAESAAILQAVRILVSAPAEFRLSSQVDSPVTFGFGPRLYSFRSVSRPWSPTSNPRLPAMSCFTSGGAIGLIISAKKRFAPCSGFIPPSFGSSRASVWLASRSSISRSSGSPTRASPTSKPCLSSPMPAHPSQPFQPRPFSPNASSSSESHSCLRRFVCLAKD